MRVSALAVFMAWALPAFAFGAEYPAYARTFGAASTPVGWKGYCIRQPKECEGGTQESVDIVMSKAVLEDMRRVNDWANRKITPLTDLDHWGVDEKWSLPDDGYGDCEDYVLLKRKTFIDAGWPRQALLITVVLDKRGDGHAVLTVKTDEGEFILDNQNDDIKDWTQTGYAFKKRQSQEDQNAWVSLEDTAPAPPQMALSRVAR